MNERKSLVSSIIISIALIVCVFILRDAYISKGYPSSQSSHINMDLSQVNQALTFANRDALVLYDAAAYLGLKQATLAAMLRQEKISGTYILINGNYVFSKKALDEWLYLKAKEHFVVTSY